MHKTRIFGPDMLGQMGEKGDHIMLGGVAQRIKSLEPTLCRQAQANSSSPQWRKP